jgi:hypothetical protein
MNTIKITETLTSAAPDLFKALKRLHSDIEFILAHEAGATRDEMLERLHRDNDGRLRGAVMALRKAKGQAN